MADLFFLFEAVGFLLIRPSKFFNVLLCLKCALYHLKMRVFFFFLMFVVFFLLGALMFIYNNIE